ncbi:hypothetical protein AERO8C_150039 [Aeromonas veronii]|uniref:Uncharacterized protein n=1 Tax=Aeromonas veronii TaxID=654 RepID=A0A653KWJ3_AERVE|nr:hypothetical protein AERO8C_150039 [Aeromonas veronii]
MAAIEAQQRFEWQHQRAPGRRSRRLVMTGPLELDKLPPFKAQHSVGQRSIGGVVAHQQQACAGVPHRRYHQRHYLFGIVLIEAAGGFVGEQPLGLVDKGAGQRHPLTLTAGELLRPGMALVAHIESVQQLVNLCLIRWQSVDGERQGQILGHVEGRQQVEILIDDTEMATPQACPLVGGSGVDPGLPQPDLPFVRCNQPGDQIEQGRLAASALAQQQGDLASGEGEIEMVEQRQSLTAVIKALAEVAQGQHGITV